MKTEKKEPTQRIYWDFPVCRLRSNHPCQGKEKQKKRDSYRIAVKSHQYSEVENNRKDKEANWKDRTLKCFQHDRNA